ncbi:recombinase family protein [Rhodococcus sp. IEGM 1318]|uniref:recombinase family protein n=1 Tax=Rhodococcus sp. IEGM 1318 TaxID=3082226 RepID=UPI00398A46B1
MKSVVKADGWDASLLDNEEAEVIRMMAATLLDGGSLRGLVDHLETEGISTVSGTAWKPITVKRALTNPCMIGKKQSGDTLVATTIPPILQPRTYKRLCELLLDPEPAKYTGDRTQVALLGGGLARCGGCGRPMYAASAVGRPTVYACSTRSSDCPSIVSVQAELLEADVIERVLARLSSPKYRKALTKSINELGSLEEGENRVAELNARFTALGRTSPTGSSIANPCALAPTEYERTSPQPN